MMDRETINILARQCGATTCRNRQSPDADGMIFHPVEWQKFCKALAEQPAPAQEPVNNQIMFKRLEAYEFAIKEYEDALKAAFPEGATGEAFHHWNAARKHGGRPYLAYEQKERPEMDADMREMQQEIDGLLKANMELQADADAWRNFKAKTLVMREKK